MKTLYLYLILGGILLTSITPQIVAIDTKPLKTLMVLQDGRVKPLDSFAKNILIQFLGKRSLKKEPAISFLARVLLNSRSTQKDPVFLINHPEVAEALNVAPIDSRKYSYKNLEPGLSKLVDLAMAVSKIKPEERSTIEKELFRIYQNVILYTSLTRSLQALLPHPDFTITNQEVLKELNLSPKNNQLSYMDIYKRIDDLNRLTAPLIKKDSSLWSDSDREIFRISKTLFEWAKVLQNNPLTLIPMPGGTQMNWVSAYDALVTPHKSKETVNQLYALQKIVKAYLGQDQAGLEKATAEFNQQVSSFLKLHNQEIPYISLEIWYNQLDPFYLSEILYGLAFILLLIFLIWDKKGLWKVSLALLVISSIPHTGGIIARMILVGRPPVTNLYETFVFVGWIVVLLGIYLEYRQKNGMGILSASFGGLVSLLVSEKFGSDGDTLRVLVAVLDSNFWLATHVITISMGYAGCCISGLIGHIYLIQDARGKNPEKLPPLYRAIYGTLAFGLLFTFIGTVLGGVWADQSWGRFWGWDPKENGALLIVLWCAILLRAKSGKMIKDRGMAHGSIVGIIVVMMAWFGINLLGVGLHSYGFTEGIAGALSLYIVIEVVFMILTQGIIYRREVSKA